MTELRFQRAGQPLRPDALTMLSPDERSRYDAAAPEQRDLFLLGRVVLRELASELTGVSPARVVISAVCPDCGGPHGRPELKGTPWHLSLARCELGVVAAASQSPIGVDVEPRAGSAARVDAIGVLTGRASLAHWTAVEAILKADGRGLRVDPSEVVIEGGHGRVSDSDATYRLFEPEIDSDLLVTIAVRKA